MMFGEARRSVPFAIPANARMYELDLPRERQPVLDDRTIKGEVAERVKTSAEVEAVRKYLGWK
jgi:hypothetical protein